jgi:hypothetical protein
MSRIWSPNRFAKNVADLIEYAFDYFDRAALPWKTKNGAMKELGVFSYVLACITAQRVPGGTQGVESEYVFEALQLWKDMPLSVRRTLALNLYSALESSTAAERHGELTPRERLALIGSIYDYVVHETSSLEHDDMLGPDLAYLMGAIIHSSSCEWPADRPIIQMLQGWAECPIEVWSYIEFEAMDDEAADETAEEQ